MVIIPNMFRKNYKDYNMKINIDVLELEISKSNTTSHSV